MTIWVKNADVGINEEFKTDNLDFIRRSYEQYSEKESMSDQDFKDLAIMIVKKRYEGTRYDNLEWIIETE